MGFSVAIQLYSLRDDFDKDPYATLKAVKEMGYDGVEIHGFIEEDQIAMLRELDLVAPSGHISYETLTTRTEYTLNYFKDLGCKYVVIPYMCDKYLPNGEGYSEVPAKLREVSEKAKEYGLTVCYHNHGTELLKFRDKTFMEHYLDDVGREYLKTEFDTTWLSVMGEEPSEYIRKNADITPVIHLKDYYRVRNTQIRPEFRPVGYGVLDIPRILDAAREVEADWIIVEQDCPSLGKTPLECAKMSIDYIRTIENFGK